MQIVITENEKKIKEKQYGLNIILTNSYFNNKKKKIFSIYSILEANRFFYKKKLLKILSSFGEIKYENKKIKNFFIIENFNFWECSVFRELILYQNNGSVNLLRFIIIIDYIKKNKVKEVYLNLNDEILEKVILQYCNHKKIKINLNKNYVTKYKIELIKIKINKFFPYIINFALYISYYLINNLIAKKKNIKNNKIIFFDIFTHINFNKIKKQKIFSSNYWQNLITFIIRKKINCDWFHIHYPQKETIHPKNSIDLVNFLNLHEKTINHNIVDRISFKKLLIIFMDYYFLYIKTYKIKKFLKKYYSLNNLNLFEFYKKEFSNYFIGNRGVKNLIYFRCFQDIIKDINYNSTAFYIYENQNWEKILNFFWNKKKCGNLYAVPHNEIRFWDLRYFDLYPTTFCKKYLKPKNFIVNSESSKSLNNLIKFNNVISLEPLRMLNFKVNFKKKNKFKKINILVVLDIFELSSQKLLKILNNVLKIEMNINKIYIKSHPANKLNLKKYSRKIILTNSPIPEILSKIDLIIGSNSTSAIYYGIYNNIPYLTFLDNDILNFSPIYPKRNKYFFNEDSFIKVLKKENYNTSFKNKYYNYTNNNISNWKNFLLSVNDKKN